MRGADAPYVPEFQRGPEPVAAMGVPGLDNGSFSAVRDRAHAQGVTAGQAGSLVERRTHVENILASLSDRRPTAWAAWRREAGGEVAPDGSQQAQDLYRAAPSLPLPPPPVPDSPLAPAVGLESRALLPRSPGAAAAARALAALAPAPGALAPIPAATPAVPPAPTGTGAQSEPLFLSAAASSAARALSSLAGAPARAASTRTTAPTGDAPPDAAPPNAVGRDSDRTGPDKAPDPDEQSGAGSDHAALDGEVPQPDPQLDDILPAKSKSFFRLRR